MKCATINAMLLTFLVCGTGCNTIRNGGAPDPTFDVSEDLDSLEAQYSNSLSIKEFYEAESKSKRDEFVAGRLVLMNIRYIEFIRTLTSEKQMLDSAADVLVLGLNLTGASVGAASTKTVLASISAGVSGTRSTIDDNYYFEKSVPALVAAMNAERKSILIEILSGLEQELDQYSFATALTDLHRYYHAGTLLGAIQTIQRDAGAKEEQKNKQLIELRPLPPEVIVTKEGLTRSIGLLGASDLEKLKDVLLVLDEPGSESPSDIDSAKMRVQRHIRNARSEDAIEKVAKAFDRAKIEYSN